MVRLPFDKLRMSGTTYRAFDEFRFLLHGGGVASGYD
jgi:hypothetical protein